MDTYLIEMLECPVCHGRLNWKINEQIGDQIEAGHADCGQCGASYPIQEGIGIFLTPDLPRNDLWELVDSQLSQYLNENPEQKRQLLDGPLENLSPTDQKFRALMLDETGKMEEAREADRISDENLYTEEYLSCWKLQTEYVLDQLSGFEGPIVDLASGRCYLVERIAAELQRPIVATDFSLQVLRRNRKYFQLLRLEQLVSLLALDARRTPFKNGAIEVMTTNLGLPNIETPTSLPSELYRVVGGTLLAISHFFPPEDSKNREVIASVGLESMLYLDEALDTFQDAGWQITLENHCQAEAHPSPPSTILEGARADGLPVSPTTLEWGVLRASH